MDEVRSGSSYNSSSDLRVHVGLGAETKVSVTVSWVGGAKETFAVDAVDKVVELVEGKGKTTP